MMTPSLFFFTTSEFGVPAFLRVVWYGVVLFDDACAPPTKRTAGPKAKRLTTPSAQQRLKSVDITPRPTSAGRGPSTAQSIRRRRSASNNSPLGTWTAHRGRLLSRACEKGGTTWPRDPR